MGSSLEAQPWPGEADISLRRNEGCTGTALAWEPALTPLTGCATLYKKLSLSVLHQLIQEPGQAKLIPSAWNISPSAFPGCFIPPPRSQLTYPLTQEASRPPIFPATPLICSKFSLFYFLHGTCTCMLNRFSHVQPFVTPWTVARQAPLSMGILQARILEWVAMPSSRGSS